MSDDFAFEGFDPANTTPVPDVFFDKLLPHLNEAQLKVMLYIIRRTLGFKKTADAISLKQFRYGIITKSGEQLDEGCGLKNMTTISKAAKDLERMGCTESEHRYSPEGDHATTVYRIRFKGTTPTVVPSTQGVLPPTPTVDGVLRQTYNRTTPNAVPVLRQTYSQETVIQETVIQETVIQQEEKSALSDDNRLIPSPLSDELAVAVNCLNANGYQVKFSGEIPGNDLLFWMHTPEGREHFDTPENIIARARTIQQQLQDATTIEADPLPSGKQSEPSTEQTAEGNRFRSLPNPSAENNVSADESSHRIGSQSDERASTSADIETQNDTLSQVVTQADANVRIARTEPQPPSTQQVEAPATPEQPIGNKRAAKPKPEKSAGPPEMPPDDARFTAEVAVQIIEAKKGRRYSDTTRSQELSAAKKVLKMEYDEGEITREHFENAVDDLLSWPFWKQHTNVKPMIRTLLKDDKIITILDDLKRKPNKNKSLNKQREDVHRQTAVTVATSVPPIDTEKLEAEKQADLLQVEKNMALLQRQREESAAKLMRGVR
jgi:hypothetical protein